MDFNAEDYAIGGSLASPTPTPYVPLQMPQDYANKEAFDNSVDTRESLARTISDSIEENWLGAQLFKDTPEYQPQADFIINREMRDKYYKDIPSQYHPDLDLSMSEGQLQYNVSKVQADLGRLQNLQKWGAVGTGVELTTAFLDPTMWLATLGPEAIAAPSILASKASKVAKYTQMGLITGTANAGYQAAVENNQVGKQGDYTGPTAAFALGALLGPLGYSGKIYKSASEAPDIANNFMQKAELQDLKDSGNVLTPEGQAIMDKPVQELESDSVGAMRATFLTKPLSQNIDDLMEAASATPKTAMANLRKSLASDLQAAENPIERQMGTQMFQDAVGKVGDAVNPYTVEESARILTEQHVGAYERAYKAAFKQYSADNNGSLLKTFKIQKQFDEAITDYMNSKGTIAAHPSVVKVANEMSNGFNSLRELAANPLKAVGGEGRAVRGFDSIDADRFYMPFKISYVKVQNFIQKYGGEQLERMIKQSYTSANSYKMGEATIKTVTNNEAQAFAKFYMKTVQGKGYNVDDLGLVRALNGEDSDRLLEELEAYLGAEKGIDVSRNDLEAVVERIKSLKAKGSDAGASSRAKHRAILDRDTKFSITTKEWGTEDISLWDALASKDATDIYKSYAQEMSGRISFAKVMDVTSDGEFMTKLGKLGEAAQRLSQSPEDAQRAMRKLKIGYDTLTGRSVEHNAGHLYNDSVRALQGIVRSTYLNNVVFSMLSEFGRVIGHAGVKSYLKQVPEFRGLWKRLKSGELEAEGARELEAIGLTDDPMLTSSVGRYEPEELDFNKATGAVSKIANATGVLSSAMYKLTLAQGMDRFLRLKAGLAVGQRMYDVAAGVTKGFSSKRLAVYGLDKDTVEAIYSSMRTHANVNERGVVKALNLSNWTDLKARDAYIHFIHRDIGTLIQKESLGSLPEQLLTSRTAKMLASLRRYPLIAYEKQFLQGIHIRDSTASMQVMTGMLGGMFGYMARTYVNSIGREDKDEYLEKRLNPKSLGLSVAAMLPESALLPMVVDTGLDFVGQDRLFDYSRQSGLPSNLITGSPAIQMFNTTYAGVSGSIKAALYDDVDLTKQTVKGLLNPIPGSRMIGVSNAINALIEDLPDDPKKF